MPSHELRLDPPIDRFDVDPIYILGECFIRDGRCYAYFGLTPTLLRLPVLGINRFFHSALTPIFLGGAILMMGMRSTGSAQPLHPSPRLTPPAATAGPTATKKETPSSGSVGAGLGRSATGSATSPERTLDRAKLAAMTTEAKLDDVLKLGPDILAGKTRGRVVVAID